MMKFLTTDQKAEAMNLAMDIDVGTVDIQDVMTYFREHDLELGRSILTFWYNASYMTHILFHRFYFETLYNDSEYTDEIHDKV